MATPARLAGVGAFVLGGIVEHDVERELERTGVLAADQACKLCKLSHAAFLPACAPPMSTRSMRNISWGSSGSTT